jgi:hypothetical protein
MKKFMRKTGKRTCFYGLVLIATVFLGLFPSSLTLAAEGKASLQVEGVVYYVSTDGNDQNPGTIDRPWKSIQHAAEVLEPGESVYVRGGVYNEMVFVEVSGSESGGSITFQSYPDETAVLDGSGLTYRYGPKGFSVYDQHHITIKGFEIRNYTSASSREVPAGIYVEGAADHIWLENNYIHHIKNTGAEAEDFQGANAYGLTVRGEDEEHTIYDVTIIGNELAYLTLGSSEALVLNGNVENFTISNNIVHDVDNIGIDLIGFEELVDDPELDRARNGVVSNNTVYNVDSGSNPAYHGDQSAAGIYVDGGRDILIEHNHVFSNNYGIELATESKTGNVLNITVRNNLIYHNHKEGLSIGGYKKGLGATENCIVVNNTFFHNDQFHDGNGELLIRYQTRNSIIENNIIYANEQNIFIHNNFVEIENNNIDHNLYYSQSGTEEGVWRWERVYYDGFDTYQETTGNDNNSLFVDPDFVDVGGLDLHLSDDSPALDMGGDSHWVGDFDIDGDPRMQGLGVDAGADEWGNSEMVFTEMIFLPSVINSRP